MPKGQGGEHFDETLLDRQVAVLLRIGDLAHKGHHITNVGEGERRL